MIGFVGFGEAGFHLARGLAIPGMVAFDLHAETPGRSEKIHSRAQAAGVRLANPPLNWRPPPTRSCVW